MAAPHWEQLTVLSGGGPLTQSLTIAKGAVQWKAVWKCDSGTLRITVDPPPRSGAPLVDAKCPGNGEGYGVKTGPARLTVEASAAWQALISQQVTTPVDEPPLPAMTAPGAKLIARGSFVDVERKGMGNALLYRLAEGRLALRLENFETSNNTDLAVWASEAPRPTTSQLATASPHVEIADLKATVGNENYAIPPDLPAEKIRSVVIWCRPVQIAYVSAALEPAA